MNMPISYRWMLTNQRPSMQRAMTLRFYKLAEHIAWPVYCLKQDTGLQTACQFAELLWIHDHRGTHDCSLFAVKLQHRLCCSSTSVFLYHLLCDEFSEGQAGALTACPV